jgi:type II secretory pathway pseudopilin PulG
MELMVVVVIVAVLAALAIPSMIKGRDDRRTYNDAASIAMLLRSARLRAMGRGAAIAINATANGTADRGTFLVYEAVGQNPTSAGQAYPFSSCTSTDWTTNAATTGTTNTTLVRNLVDGLNLNGQIEQNMNLQTVLASSTLNNAVASYWMCYTPTGRVFENTAPAFGTAAAFTSLDICVGRYGATSPTDCTGTVHATGPLRHVLVPPTGLTRIYSK